MAPAVPLRLDSAPRPWLAPTVLLTAVALAYANTLHAPFLFDDAGAVVDNPTIRRLGSLAIFQPPTDGSTTTGRPLVNFTFALNYALSGENVWSYHALNLAIHALAALALYGLLRLTRGTAAVALAAPALWALHPLQTESVTCIAQRTESLCGLFFLFTFYAFARGSAAPQPVSRTWLALSVLSCALGMTTKEVMVTAPVLVLLYDRTFVAGSFAAAWRARRTYYLALAATWLVLALLVALNAGARGASAGFGLGVTPWTYLLKQCEALVLYVRLAVWPYPLVLDYGTAVTASLTAVWWQGIVILAALAATVWALVRRPALGFVGAWFFLILAPSSSFVPLVTQTMAEHRMYLPLAALVALGAVALHARFGPSARWVLALLSVGWGSATIARNHAYRDAVTIWADTAAKRPANPRAHNNLALALVAAGRAGDADTHYARAVALDPAYVSARYNWAVALLATDRPGPAAEQLAAVVRLAPNHADARVNLGNALVRLRRAPEAVPHYEHALRLRPAADAHYNLGVALAESQRSPTSVPVPTATSTTASDAATHFRAALALDPRLADAHYQLARIAEQSGQLADAERDYAATLRLAPDHLAAHRRLGLLHARAERLAPAAVHFRAVLRLAPADADAHANLANVLLLAGQPREAIALYEAALRLRPGDARTRENLRLAREAAP